MKCNCKRRRWRGGGKYFSCRVNGNWNKDARSKCDWSDLSTWQRGPLRWRYKVWSVLAKRIKTLTFRSNEFEHVWLFVHYITIDVDVGILKYIEKGNRMMFTSIPPGFNFKFQRWEQTQDSSISYTCISWTYWVWIGRL